MPPPPGPEAIVVVGAGITGIVAALELLSRGVPVTLLDRDVESRIGGQARESFGGIFAVDTPIQRRRGIRDSVELALADWSRFGDIGPADGWPYRWAQAYVRNCRRDVYDWVRAQGVRFLPMPLRPEQAGNSVARWHIVWGTGSRLVQCLLERLRVLERGRLQLRCGHRVERLLIESGRVVGVAGRVESSGEPFAFRGRAVLVAAGGIGGDLAQIRALWPAALGAAPKELLIGSHRFADGRLHDACREAGAEILHLERMWNYAAGVAHWDPPQPRYGLSLVPPRSALWLDAEGRRFDPPLLAGRDTSELVARIAAAGGESWQVLNRRIALRELAVSGAEFNPAMRERRPLAVARDFLFGNRWLVETMLRNCPDFVAANTVPELVERMNACASSAAGAVVPGRVRLEWLERSVREFDAALLAGDSSPDPQVQSILAARSTRAERLRTARPGALLEAGSGPLIAIRERILTRKSLGGIHTDLEGRVLDGTGAPIPGLYAAGEASGFGGGGMNGRRALEGTFLGGCIYSARRAAAGLNAEVEAGPG